MIDEHAEQHLDQTEINANNIDTNKYSILQNRIMIFTFFVLLLTLNIGGIIILKHDMHDCEETLWNKVVKEGYVIEKDKHE